MDNGGREYKAEYYKKYSASHWGRYRVYIASAKGRDIEFSLSYELFSKLVTKPCAYCGESKEKRGIDRIDNDLPYIESNCVPCCKYCNYMKKDMTGEEFLERVKQIVAYQVTATI